MQSNLKETVFSLLGNYTTDYGIELKPTLKGLKELNHYSIEYQPFTLKVKEGTFNCELPHNSLIIVAESIIRTERYKANPNIKNPIKVDIEEQLRKAKASTIAARVKMGVPEWDW